MNAILKKIMPLCLMLALALQGYGQQEKTWREMHQVKKKETVYGIAKMYGITEEELRNANPEMKMEGYTLHKGDYIFIPYAKPQPATPTPVPSASADVRQRAIRMGVMLPLHNNDGDGRRMIEYYRGILMAVENLKEEGISVNAHAWNVPIDGNISETLADPDARQCDIIFGPLYTRQMDALTKFCQDNDIKLVVPFSIEGQHVQDNPNMFQVYQRPSELEMETAERFIERFGNSHVVIIDCNDTESSKGTFTTLLRAKLEGNKQRYSITNLTSSEQTFAKAFSLEKPNVVVLNTGRSPQLNEVLKKLDVLSAANKSLTISLFGYNDWLMYEKYDLEQFYKYDTFIPTYYYYNSASTKTRLLESTYRQRFGTEMQPSLPRFAITGYDQARFFLRGLHAQGKTFTGETPDKDALQTTYKFVRQGEKGGMKNKMFMLMHYNRNRTVSSIVY